MALGFRDQGTAGTRKPKTLEQQQVLPRSSPALRWTSQPTQSCRTSADAPSWCAQGVFPVFSARLLLKGGNAACVRQLGTCEEPLLVPTRHISGHLRPTVTLSPCIAGIHCGIILPTTLSKDLQLWYGRVFWCIQPGNPKSGNCLKISQIYFSCSISVCGIWRSKDSVSDSFCYFTKRIIHLVTHLVLLLLFIIPLGRQLFERTSYVCLL